MVLSSGIHRWRYLHHEVIVLEGGGLKLLENDVN